MSGRPWTEQQADEAIRLYQQGCSGGEIAAALGRGSRNEVICKLDRMGALRANSDVRLDALIRRRTAAICARVDAKLTGRAA